MYLQNPIDKEGAHDPKHRKGALEYPLVLHLSSANKFRHCVMFTREGSVPRAAMRSGSATVDGRSKFPSEAIIFPISNQGNLIRFEKKEAEEVG